MRFTAKTASASGAAVKKYTGVFASSTDTVASRLAPMRASIGVPTVPPGNPERCQHLDLSLESCAAVADHRRHDDRIEAVLGEGDRLRLVPDRCEPRERLRADEVVDAASIRKVYRGSLRRRYESCGWANVANLCAAETD